MGKVKIGVLGAQRGKVMIRFMLHYPEAELVAVCDKHPAALGECRAEAEKAGVKVRFFSDFEQFLGCDMDAVILANYATEHTPYALRCFETGRHVLSEVMPAQTLGEAVQLVEAVEKSGLIYAYAENYCYMRAVLEMKRRYRRGDIGEFVYGEGEYVHDCTAEWEKLTGGDPNHWRNRAYASFYLSHSLGPLVAITGCVPERITAFETQQNRAMAEMGYRAATAASVLVKMKNGAVVRALKGHLKRSVPSVWYSIYGDRGSMESDRFGKRTYMLSAYTEGERPGEGDFSYYEPEREIDTPFSRSFESPEGHSGSDFYTCYYFLEKLLGRPGGQNCIDVYQAMDMSLPGILAYRSILSGGMPVEYPDLREPAARERCRGDRACTDPAVAGDALLPARAGEQIKK